MRASCGRTLSTVLTMAAASALLHCGQAKAQQLDYSRYEGLFGEAVTESATGKPERISDTPVLMDVITAQDIAHSGARDIPTLLDRLAGLSVLHTSVSSVEVGIRGYQQSIGSRVMVLINGRQVYFDGFGDVFWAALPVELEEIRQIEVVKGPQSALYGFNAVDGVINIVTFDPVDDRLNLVRGRVGNRGRRDLSAIVTEPLGDAAGVRLTVGTDHADDDGLIPVTPQDANYTKDPNRRAASFNAAATLPDGSRFDAEASHTDITERSFVYGVVYNARVVTDSAKAAYTADSSLGRINGTAYFTGLDIPWVQTVSLPSSGVGDRMLVAQLSDLFKLGANDSFRVAGEARRDSLSASAMTYGTLTGTLGSGSVMWDHRFAPTLSMVNAVRYDDFELARSGPALPLGLYTNSDFDRSLQGTSVNSALIAKATADDTLRLSFARGLKLPSLSDFGQISHFLGPMWSPYHYGNPTLIQSAVYDYQAGWDHTLAGLGARLRLDVYHQMTMHHVGTSVLEVDSIPVQLSTMSAGSVANGAELELANTAKLGWRWSANYSLEQLHEHADLGYSGAQPRHKINAALGYGWSAWEADLHGAFTSASKGTAVNYLEYPPAVTTVSLSSTVTLSPRVAWHATDFLTIEAVGESLWPYRDTVVQKMDAGGYLSVKVTY